MQATAFGCPRNSTWSLQRDSRSLSAAQHAVNLRFDHFHAKNGVEERYKIDNGLCREEKDLGGVVWRYIRSQDRAHSNLESDASLPGSLTLKEHFPILWQLLSTSRFSSTGCGPVQQPILEARSANLLILPGDHSIKFVFATSHMSSWIRDTY